MAVLKQGPTVLWQLWQMCAVTHNIPTAVGAPNGCMSQLQCCSGISLILVSDPTALFPAAFFIFQWSSLLQHSYNRSPSNL